MKLEKIEKEMQKTRDKIAELQKYLKELATQQTEQENLQIVSLVRSLNLSAQQLKEYLQGTAEQQTTPAVSVTATDTNYYDAQEDSEDEA